MELEIFQGLHPSLEPKHEFQKFSDEYYVGNEIFEKVKPGFYTVVKDLDYTKILMRLRRINDSKECGEKKVFKSLKHDENSHRFYCISEGEIEERFVRQFIKEEGVNV